jgi:carbon-monoxide dehydrogenase medium subunit
MNLWQHYSRPQSLSEAIAALQAGPGPAIPIAGGTDLMLDLQQGRRAPVHTLVDLTCVREMKALELRGDELFIGASVPVSSIVSHPLAREHAQALVEAASLIGGPQVRNSATLGGNVSHALPAGDGTIALSALAAEVEVASMEGVRRVPFSGLFLGPGKSALQAGKELAVGFYVSRITTGQASCFKRVMRPQGVALPILNCAVWVARKDEKINDIRIAVGPAGPIPFRAKQTEAFLRQQIQINGAAAAAEVLLGEAHFRSSPQRASSEYRRHLSVELFRATLEEAWSRAGRA